MQDPVNLRLCQRGLDGGGKALRLHHAIDHRGDDRHASELDITGAILAGEVEQRP